MTQDAAFGAVAFASRTPPRRAAVRARLDALAAFASFGMKKGGGSGKAGIFSKWRQRKGEVAEF